MNKYYYCNNCDEYGSIPIAIPNMTMEEFEKIKHCSCGNKNITIVDPTVVALNQNRRIIDLLGEIRNK